jgi:ABC-2 type transport system permease protein
MFSLNPIFYREMLLLRKKTMRLGYLFSTLLFPLLYLFAFGWGLGSKVRLDGISYVNFLVPGLLAMTAMNNAFNLSATSVGMGRLFSRTMQPILIAPVSRCSIVNGYLLAGLVRGMIACAIVALAALLLFGTASLPLTFPALIGLLLAMTFFALAGLLAGLLIKDLEDIAVITNFIIMPMAFFSGTFFPS